MKKTTPFIFIPILAIVGLSISFSSKQKSKTTSQSVLSILKTMSDNKESISSVNIDSAVFAAGCFWCVEAQFQQLKGVQKIVSGYMGGTKENPTYAEVCTGTTGHAEVVKVFYDPNVITYEELLAAFFIAHDPTQLNRQGNDIGTQYRSEIFYNTNAEQGKANFYINKLNQEQIYDLPIVTKVSEASTFYPAEDYHQNYYNLNSGQGYCQMVIKPKLEKFKKVFEEKMK